MTASLTAARCTWWTSGENLTYDASYRGAWRARPPFARPGNTNPRSRRVTRTLHIEHHATSEQVAISLPDQRSPDGTPFYAADCERELIGAALLSEPEHVLAVTLDRNDFRDRNLGVIWAAVQESARMGNPCIPVTAWLLDKAGVLDKVGSEVLLAQLAGRALVEQPFPHLTLLTHPQIIHEWAVRRAGLAEAQTMARRAINGDLPDNRGGVAL